MNKKFSASYPLGALKAIEMNEGNEELWRKQGIEPLSKAWEQKLEGLTEIVVGGYNLNDLDVERVIGSVCIYKSKGKFRELPLSFLSELLVIFMFAKKLNVEGLVLIPIAEEVYNYPNCEKEFLALGDQLGEFITNLANKLGVKVNASTSEGLITSEIKKGKLYGLFQPYTEDPYKKIYPLGLINEEEILKGYESYCLRYRHPEGGLGKGDLVVDGIHLSQSVILGIENVAKYIPTVPLPSLNEDEKILLVDSDPYPTIVEKKLDLSTIKGFQHLLREILGCDLEDVLKISQIQFAAITP